MTSFDMVLRDGTIVDGTGMPPFNGDVAIDSGRIVLVGRVEGRGREEIAAGGSRQGKACRAARDGLNGHIGFTKEA